MLVGGISGFRYLSQEEVSWQRQLKSAWGVCFLILSVCILLYHELKNTKMEVQPVPQQDFDEEFVEKLQFSYLMYSIKNIKPHRQK